MVSGNKPLQFVDLERVSPKRLDELERRVQELLSTIQRVKLVDKPLVESLRLLEQTLEETRRARFDESNSEYRGY